MPVSSLQLNPQNLQTLNGLDPTWGRQAWQWRNRANQMDQVTLEDLIRAAQHEKQMDPLRIEKQRADIDSTLANIGQTKASTEMTRSKTKQQNMENEVFEHTLPQQKATAYRKLLSEASDADLKTHENEVYTGLQSNDPNTRRMAQAALPYLKFAVQERLKTDIDTAGKLKVQGASDAAAAARQQALFKHNAEMEDKRIAAGKYVKKSDQAANDIMMAVKAGKLTYEKAATSFEILAAVEEDEKKKALYADLAAKFGQEALKNNVPKPGSPDIGQLGGIPTNAAPSTGLGQPAPAVANRPDRQQEAAAQKKEDWIKRAMTANPGMTREQVEAEGKKLGKF